MAQPNLPIVRHTLERLRDEPKETGMGSFLHEEINKNDRKVRNSEKLGMKIGKYA